MTETEILAYVASLGDPLPEIYQAADLFCLCADDTLSEEFQIAAEVLAAFERRAQRREKAVLKLAAWRDELRQEAEQADRDWLAGKLDLAERNEPFRALAILDDCLRIVREDNP